MSNSMQQAGRTLGVAAVLGFVQIATAANGIVGLGRPAGGTYPANAYAISADGGTIAGITGVFQPTLDPFRWTAATGITRVDGLGGERTTRDVAYGLSGDGATVVGTAVDPEGRVRAFRNTVANGTAGLGFLPGSTLGSTAYDASFDGRVIVGNAGDPTAGSVAFRWTPETGMTGLGGLPGGPANPRATAYAVNRAGDVIVGRADRATNDERAFRWTAATGMVSLASRDFPFTSTATDVNADGNVVVGTGSISVNSTSTNGAFRWTSATGMVYLGDLPGGLAESQATAVSDNGDVVIGQSFSSNGSEPFYWTPATGMRSLNNVLLANGVNIAASGWTSLGSARAISADGLTVTGYGMHLGRYEAYVATIPEPVSVAVAAVLVTGLVRRRTRPRPVDNG